MINRDPLLPPRLVGKCFGINRLPGEFFKSLLDRLCVTKEDRISLSPYGRYIHGLHVFLGQFATGIDPIPGFSNQALLAVNQDRTVHLLHSLFSVMAVFYVTTIIPYAFIRDILEV